MTRQDSANNTYQMFGRDSDLRLVSTLTYNATSQIMAKTKGGVTTNYTDDLAGQLTGESKTGYRASYSYDSNGNRLTRTLNGTTESYTYDDGDHMLTVRIAPEQAHSAQAWSPCGHTPLSS